MTPEQELDEAIRQHPDEAMPTMVKVIFKQTAEIAAGVDALVLVVGAIAGKVGMSAQQVRELVDRSER